MILYYLIIYYYNLLRGYKIVFDPGDPPSHAAIGLEAFLGSNPLTDFIYPKTQYFYSYMFAINNAAFAVDDIEAEHKTESRYYA